MSFARKWVELEIIVLREISQTQANTLFLLIHSLKISNNNRCLCGGLVKKLPT